ncbi:hypothetical protein [Paenibacillus naphthalenovorans]|uniref:hypothetical protein n=1 Tax=Paenibacillus naphthalenovorans TaxID=162209 RepID=UPI003D28F3B6
MLINNLFGKPKLPIVLSDSILLIDEKKVIPLEQVCFFITKSIITISRIGDEWVNDKKVDRVRTVGYFISNHPDIFTVELGLLNENHRSMKIVGNVKKNQYQLLNVSFGKTNVSFGEQSRFEAKFSATQVDLIVI